MSCQRITAAERIERLMRDFDAASVEDVFWTACSTLWRR
jgi:hypothetical protein